MRLARSLHTSGIAPSHAAWCSVLRLHHFIASWHALRLLWSLPPMAPRMVASWSAVRSSGKVWGCAALGRRCAGGAGDRRRRDASGRSSSLLLLSSRSTRVGGRRLRAGAGSSPGTGVPRSRVSVASSSTVKVRLPSGLIVTPVGDDGASLLRLGSVISRAFLLEAHNAGVICECMVAAPTSRATRPDARTQLALSLAGRARSLSDPSARQSPRSKPDSTRGSPVS